MTAQQAVTQFGAQMYLPWPGDPTGETPQMFYRWRSCVNHVGGVHTSLQYLTFANLWHCSMGADSEAYAREDLKPIPGVEPYDREAMEKKMLDHWNKLHKKSEQDTRRK